MRDDKADGASAPVVQTRKFSVRRLVRDDHDDAGGHAELSGGFHRAAVVGSIHARLNEHRSRDTERLKKMATRRRKRVRWRVFSIAAVRVAGGRSEDMEVGVDGRARG
jgi:hypothetical protein